MAKRPEFSPAAAVGAVVLIAVVVIVAYWPALDARAFFFDDREYLIENQLVQEPGLDSAWRFVREVGNPSTVAGYYQPLSMISLMLDYAMGGRVDELRTFHRTSLALHVLNALLVAGLLFGLFRRVWPAALCGLIFGLHPAMAESIPWVAERKTVLATFFTLGCLSCYVHYARGSRRWGWYAAALVLLVFALLSKPTATPVPILLLILDYWPLNRLSRRAVVEKIPFALVAGVSAVVTVISQSARLTTTVPGDESAASTFLVVCHNIVWYLGAAFWPANLTPYYPYPNPMAISHPMVLAGVLGTCVLAVVLVVAFWRSRPTFVAGAFFAVAILPVVGIVGFHHNITADRHLYFPIIGLLLPVGWLLGRLWDGSSRPLPAVASSALGTPARRRAVIVVVVAALAIAETVAVRRYLVHWTDTSSLYRHMLALAPEASVLHYGQGRLYQDQGRFAEAIASYRNAIIYKRDLPIERAWAGEAHNNLGGLLLARGEVKEAVRHFTEGWETSENRVSIANNLAWLMATNADESVRNGAKAVEIAEYACKATDYRNPTMLDTLAAAFAEAGRFEEAIAAVKKAISLAPVEDTHLIAEMKKRLSLYESGKPYRG
jgi:hypothetical protein